MANNDFDGQSSLNGDAKILLRLLQQRLDMFENNVMGKIESFGKLFDSISEKVSRNTQDIALLKASDCDKKASCSKLEADVDDVKNRVSVIERDITDLADMKSMLTKAIISAVSTLIIAVAGLVALILRSGLI